MPQNLKDPSFYDDLMSALHDLVKFAPSRNSARRIAALTNMPYSTLMNGLSQTESNAGCNLPAQAFEALVSGAGGERFMARYFAIRAGGVFVPLPDVDFASPLDKASIAAIKEFGELVAAYGAALEDGAVSHDDLLSIQKEGREAVEAILALIKHAEKLEE